MAVKKTAIKKSNSFKVAFAGGRRSRAFFNIFLNHPETEIVALCDPNEETLAASGKEIGVTQLYTVYEKMLDEAKPDAVVVGSPMHFHVAQSIAALQRNIHVMCEVTAAVSLDEARWLVREAGRSQALYMMAENCLYMKPNVLIKAMVDAGLFGETFYAEGEYLHDVQKLFFTPEGKPTWRYYWQVGVNGATYPTHSLGPCLAWLGERPQRISCIGAGHRSNRDYAMENTVLLLCKTQSDKLIRIRQDIISRRPQARLNYTLQGTKGVYESARRGGEGNWVWLEDVSRDAEAWIPLQNFEEEFLPEAWRNLPPEAIAAGHDGSDYFEVMEFIDAVQGRRAPSIGIHEAMDMTLPGLVSQESIQRDGEWLEVPDSRAWTA